LEILLFTESRREPFPPGRARPITNGWRQETRWGEHGGESGDGRSSANQGQRPSPPGGHFARVKAKIGDADAKAGRQSGLGGEPGAVTARDEKMLAELAQSTSGAESRRVKRKLRAIFRSFLWDMRRASVVALRKQAQVHVRHLSTPNRFRNRRHGAVMVLAASLF